MQRSLNKRSGHAVLWAVVWFFGVLILGVGLYFASKSNLYTTKKSVSFADLPPTAALVTPVNTVPNDSAYLDVWLDTGKSMDGFLYESSGNIIPSAYRAVVDSLPDLARTVGNIASTEYYHFNSTFNFLDEDLTDVDQQQKRNELTIALSDYKEPLSDELSGIKDVKKEGKSVSLPSVLNALNLKNPSIILTDFEADGFTLPGEEYEQPLNRIYSAGLCVYVVGMKSAFSGVLYNYTNKGTNYAYGTREDKSSTRLPYKRNTYHPQARSFYVIIVATSRQCEKLKNELQQTYEGYKKTVLNGKDTLLKMDGYEAVDYVDFKTANYCLNSTYDVITAVDDESATVDDKAATVTAGEGFKPANTNALGVPEFSCDKTEILKTATLNFSIKPASGSYADTYKTDVYSIPAVKMQKVELTYTTVDQLNDGDTALLARGNRRVIPNYVDFIDSGNWFSFSKVTPLEDGITFTLTVNAAQCEAGLYSLTIPVTCTHSTEAQVGDADWIDVWSEDSTKLSKDIGNKEYVVLKTLDLKPQLEHFRTADLKQNHKEIDDVANLTIHLNIQ